MAIEGFWERVEESIRNSGLTKKEIAKKMGVNRATLYPSSGMNLSTDNIAKFCKIVGVSSDYLLGLKEGM